MKITGISATLFRDSLLGPASGCLVEITADAGLCGIAIASPWARPAILALGKDMLLGEDPRSSAAFWQRAGQLMTSHGDAALGHARAVLDVAIWDLKAKAQSEPLWKTLGGGRPRANAYLSCTDAIADEAAFTEFLDLASSGLNMRGAKLAVGVDAQDNARRLARLRQALRPFTHEPQLMLDAGGRWRPKDAIRHIRALESGCDLTWVQGVADNGDFLGSRRVSNSIRAAVCAGRDLTTLSAFLPWFHHQAANVIEIDMHHFGVTGAMQLADAAYGYELPVTLTATPGNIHAHLAAVMPSFMSMEVLPSELGDSVIKSDVRFESGWGIAGDALGTGLIFNRKFPGNVTLEPVKDAEAT
jgi:L-alanine-DL-glutamate epimerase-like enolase superfamily enzyme